jgi:hypothetical protein
MIRRLRRDQFLLIAQHDHALLAGEMAQRVGNAQFVPPGPYGPVLSAIAEHDCGWASQDARPARNAQNIPAHVFEIDPDIALEAWSASVEKVAGKNPYAGLLVSMHAMALAAHAVHARADPLPDLARRQVFKFNKFIHDQIEIQERLRRHLAMRVDLPLRNGLAEAGRAPDEDLLLANFRLLQFLDQLSLILCFDELLFEQIGPVNPRPGVASETLRIDRRPDGAVRVAPWPFDVERFRLSVPAKTIAARPYADDTDLHAALAAATPQTLWVRLEA